MIKHNLMNWEYSEDLEGLLFFAQRMNEALFDFSPDKYKAPALYTTSSCLEVLRTIQEVKENDWPIKTLETVFEEFKYLYHNDDIAQQLVNADVKYYFMPITFEQIDEIKVKLELIFFKIRPIKYFELLKERLISVIREGREKSKIETYSLKLISLLQHIGYSQNYIYTSTNSFFFKEKRVNSVTVLNEYFSIFDMQEREYEVYLRISSLFNSLKDACKIFNIETFKADEIQSFKQIKKRSDKECLIKITKIKALDPYSARRIANNTLQKMGDLFTFFHHKKRLIWSENVIVKDIQANTELRCIEKASPMKKGVDYYPQKAAKRLEEMLMTLSLQNESFFRINRGIDFHGTSLENKVPENQLIQNWIALETLIVTDNSDSKINLILKGLLPILNYHYIKRIFSDLVTDIERLENENINLIINKIPEGESSLDKVVALCTIKTNLDIAKELLAACPDFPLLKFRIFSLNKSFSSFEGIISFLDDHRKRVEWHIRRIYRTRNLIVHSGQVPDIIESLVESSHSYLDSFINIMMDLSSKEKQIRTINQGIKEIQIRNRIHIDYLKKHKLDECNSDNFKLALWGEF